jgi:hypothetical protein
MVAANDDGNVPIAEIVCNSPGMNPPRSLPSTNAEQKQQQATNILHQQQQQRSNRARARAMAAANDDGDVPITKIVRNSPGMIQEQQSTNTLRPGAESGSSTTAEQQQEQDADEDSEEEYSARSDDGSDTSDEEDSDRGVGKCRCNPFF